MRTFFDKLEERCRTANTLLCVGIDPQVSDLPQPTAEALQQYCLEIIEQCAPYAAAFKPNSAFFEAFGSDGWAVLKEIIAHVPKDIAVILDVKRGDIASSAQAYARAAFEWLGADAVTVNPYLGKDAVEPFLSYPGRGAFLLCKTSNPGANVLQEARLIGEGGRGEILYERVAHLANQLNQAGNVGLVAGATYPEAIERIRAIVPEMWLLAPGVGAQGGDLEAAIRSGLRQDGLGMLINVSRSISHSPNRSEAARQFREQINRYRQQISQNRGRDSVRSAFPPQTRRIADGLLES